MEVFNWSIGAIFSGALFIQLWHDNLTLFTLFLFLVGNILCAVQGILNELLYIPIPSVIQTILLFIIFIKKWNKPKIEQDTLLIDL